MTETPAPATGPAVAPAAPLPADGQPTRDQPTRDHAATAPARLATRLAFFVAGFAISCWAPLVPFAKARVGVDEAGLGLLLLCLGIGSVIAMPVTGMVSARKGARGMILTGGFGMAILLPLLIVATTPLTLGLVLLLLGAALGTLDVAMNVHAVEVEEAEARPLMSGFHALFSVGGVVGAGGVTALLSAGLAPLGAALVGALLSVVAMALAAPRLLRARAGEAPPFALPRGVVLLLALLAAIMFLVEGAILDWGALLLVGQGRVETAQGGLGYLFFAVAMTVGRFTGDLVVARIGRLGALVGGGLLAALGLAVALAVPLTWAALTGFALVGLGAANLVPVLFSLAGKQKVMPAGMAIAAVTTTGYAGILLGPAMIGFVSEATSLPVAFWLLAALTLAIPLTASRAIRV